MNEFKTDKESYGSWRFAHDIYNASKNADAIVVATEWDEYRNLDWRNSQSFEKAIMDI